jgi:hypothetical protein
MLLLCLSRQCFYDGDILQELLRQTVPLHNVVRAVVRNPNFLLAIFPNKNLQRQVDGNAGSSQHQRCARLGTAKNQQLSRTHAHSQLFCFSAVVDQCKQSDSLRLQNILELFHCLLDRVIARPVDDSIAVVDAILGISSLLLEYTFTDHTAMVTSPICVFHIKHEQ